MGYRNGVAVIILIMGLQSVLGFECILNNLSFALIGVCVYKKFIFIIMGTLQDPKRYL